MKCKNCGTKMLGTARDDSNNFLVVLWICAECGISCLETMKRGTSMKQENILKDFKPTTL